MTYVPKVWEAGVDTFNKTDMDHLETQYTEAVAVARGAGTGMAWPTRAVNTIYQNTGDQPILVIAALSFAQAGALYVRLKSSSPPTNWVTMTQVPTTGWIVPVSFIVPVGWYWNIYTTVSVTVVSCSEMAICG
jgi:hypothetical protein